MAFSSLFFRHFIFVMFLMNKTFVSSTSTFLPNTPGREWKKVGYLNMTDPTQRCPDSWQAITSPRSSCGKKSNVPCDSLYVSTSGASYQTVCGRFRGYQLGTPDAFHKAVDTIPTNIETYYVDGVTVTYGSPGTRNHVFTYAAGFLEINNSYSCPCAGGLAPPSFVGSDYYCESGNPGPGYDVTQLYYSDVLWDRQQCGGDESTCCNPPDQPWFCKTFPNPISEDLEVRICTDQYDDNVVIESFELYIQAASVVISPSHDYTTFENNASTITFNCSGNGTSLLWTVDGNSIKHNNTGIKATHFISSPDRLTVSSQLVVPTTKANNNISVICAVLDSLLNLQSSNPVKLFLQGILPPPQQFQVNLSNCTVNLSWIAPYSLQVSTPPTISYYVLSNNLTNSTKTFNNPTTCNPLASCNYSLDLRDPFFITIGSSGWKNKEETILNYNGTMEFTFFAVNGAGNGNAATITYISTKRTQAGSQIKVLTTNTAAINMATPTITIMDYTNQTREISSTIIYGTICGVSAIMVSTVVGVVSLYVCIRCKHKGKMENTRIEMEENNAYQGIKKLPSSLTGEDMEPCPAYGIVL